MEGIILKKVLFNESDIIVTIFTKELGLISVMIKKQALSKRNREVLTSLLSKVEVHVAKGKGELYHFRDISLLDQYMELREDYDCLFYAGKMIKLVLKTQLKDKPVTPLYQLTSSYLEEMKKGKSLEALLVSFYLKLLRHEGLFTHEDWPFEMTEQEREDLIILAGTRKFEDITSISLAPKIIESVESLLTFQFS